VTHLAGNLWFLGGVAVVLFAVIVFGARRVALVAAAVVLFPFAVVSVIILAVLGAVSVAADEWQFRRQRAAALDEWERVTFPKWAAAKLGEEGRKP
jgi:hypothetical protein